MLTDHKLARSRSKATMSDSRKDERRAYVRAVRRSGRALTRTALNIEREADDLDVALSCETDANDEWLDRLLDLADEDFEDDLLHDWKGESYPQ